MSYGSDKVLTEKRGSVGWIIFNQPAKRNAMSLDMWQALPAILDDFESDPDIRSVVLTGAGDEAFVAGADISEFETHRATPHDVAAYENHVDAATHRLAASQLPTIARIRGFCIGGGLAIALGCDLRIATPQSTFAIPAAKLGLGYRHGGIRTLMGLVGPGFAREIFFTARQFSAEEAYQMRLINRIVSDDKIDALVDSYCAMIAANAPLTIRAAKITMNEIAKSPAGFDAEFCERLVQECFDSEDYTEGRRAFMEKRKPEFRGR